MADGFRMAVVWREIGQILNEIALVICTIIGMGGGFLAGFAAGVWWSYDWWMSFVR